MAKNFVPERLTEDGQNFNPSADVRCASEPRMEQSLRRCAYLIGFRFHTSPLLSILRSRSACVGHTFPLPVSCSCSRLVSFSVFFTFLSILSVLSVPFPLPRPPTDSHRVSISTLIVLLFYLQIDPRCLLVLKIIAVWARPLASLSRFSFVDLSVFSLFAYLIPLALEPPSAYKKLAILVELQYQPLYFLVFLVPLFTSEFDLCSQPACCSHLFLVIRRRASFDFDARNSSPRGVAY